MLWARFFCESSKEYKKISCYSSHCFKGMREVAGEPMSRAPREPEHQIMGNLLSEPRAQHITGDS